MAKLRPLVAVALGLTLWVQGLAIAAAPVEATGESAAAMEMPCHGEAAPCDCCDDGCPNMASCVIGHFFAAGPASSSVVVAGQPVAATRGWSSKTAVVPLPLRPPIVSHA